MCMRITDATSVGFGRPETVQVSRKTTHIRVGVLLPALKTQDAH
jgi:hypothetical protein